MLSLMRVAICLGFAVILNLHRFSLPVLVLWSIMMVGRALLLIPPVLSAGANPKRRLLFHAVRDRAFLPGPPCIWDSGLVSIPTSAICAEDVAHWPKTHCFFWLSGSLFLAVYIGLLVAWILGSVEFLMWSCLFFMN